MFITKETKEKFTKNKWQKCLVLSLLWLIFPFLAQSQPQKSNLWVASQPDKTPSSAPDTSPNNVQLPTLGDGSEMSSSAERALGDRIIRQLYRDPDYIDDPVLVEYVQQIWFDLRQAARQRGELTAELDERFAWEVLLGRDRSVNAFALPGGYFGLHLGLIGITANRDELASVMAHELSHVTQRHISRLMTSRNQQAPWLLGAMVLGALAASKSPDAANALVVGGQAAAMQNQLNFSRDMEREADRVGFGVMQQAGFAPRGFVTMFDKLDQASRLNDRGGFAYLRSHPLSTQRMADMQARQELRADAATTSAPLIEYSLIAARARVLSRPSADVLRNWVQRPLAADFATQTLAQRAAALYAAAMVHLQQRDYGRAKAMAAQLQSLVQSDVAAARLATLLLIEVAQQAGQATAIQPLLDVSPMRRPELILAAQGVLALQVRSGDVASALNQGKGLGAEAQNSSDYASNEVRNTVAALQTWLLSHPKDAQIWQLLGRIYAQQNSPLRAIRAEAESFVAQLDYEAALDRLKAAQAQARTKNSAENYVDAAIIDTRLREVSALLELSRENSF